MSVFTSYPWYFTIFCIAAGLAYAAVLYYKNANEEFSKKTLYGLSVLRFVSVFLISFLLLSPFIKMQRKQVEQPLVLVLQDQSESLKLNDPKQFNVNQWPSLFDELQNQLSSKYEVISMGLGDRLSETPDFTYPDKTTNIASAFDELAITYENRNIGAVVLISDGIYNMGENPLYAYQKLGHPLYTVALGDTTPKKDIRIQRVNHNRYAFLGNKFPLEVEISADKVRNENVKLRVSTGGKQVFEQELAIDRDPFFVQIPLQLQAEKEGVQRYTISVSSLKDELTTKNNVKDILVEVIDGRQQILLLAAAPHPDLGAIKNSIETNERYEVKVAMLDDFSGKLSEYNMLILHQIPSTKGRSATALLTELQNKHIPAWFLIGLQTDINALNTLNLGLQMQVRNAQPNDAYPALNEQFSMFGIPDGLSSTTNMFPPLQTAFAKYTTSENAQVLFVQKVLGVKTSDPLLLITQTPYAKYAFTIGEGMWKWRLQEFAQKNETGAFDQLTSKLVQLLSVQDDKRPLRVTAMPVYRENETVEMDAELYNEAFEFVPNAEIQMQIKNAEGTKYDFQFTAGAQNYHLNAGFFPAGEYTYEASATHSGKKYRMQGRFMVAAVDIESLRLTADHQLLYTMSKRYGGAMFEPTQIKELVKAIEARDDVRPVIYARKTYKELIQSKLLFTIIVLLLSAEWFIRRYEGSY